jgi:predicted transcriptional regulator
MENERRYASSEVAKRILVEPVTVRKYSQMLEEKGYVFERDNDRCSSTRKFNRTKEGKLLLNPNEPFDKEWFDNDKAYNV